MLSDTGLLTDSFSSSPATEAGGSSQTNSAPTSVIYFKHDKLQPLSRRPPSPPKAAALPGAWPKNYGDNKPDPVEPEEPEEPEDHEELEEHIPQDIPTGAHYQPYKRTGNTLRQHMRYAWKPTANCQAPDDPKYHDNNDQEGGGHMQGR